MANYKILLVEDDAIEAMDIKRKLENFGYEVPYVASRGEEAINKALDISPDLILMDITLKGKIDGIQVASNIKDIKIPLIYLTAHFDEATLQRAKITEPYGYIIKPFDPLELKYAIEIALYKKSEDKIRENEEKLRIKAENELKIANLYNRSLIEASLDPLVTIGPDGKIMDVNKATEKVTGYLRNELIGTDFSDYFTEPDKAREGYANVFKEGMVRDYPLKIQHKNGVVTSVLYNASVYCDESGEVVGVLATARDITELKESENRIKESEERMRLAFEATQIGLWDWDVKKDNWYASPVYYSMLGYDPHPGHGNRMEWLKRVHPDDQADVKEKIDNVLIHNFDSYEYEARILHADGKYRWVNVFGFGIDRDMKGKVTRILGIRMDITDRKMADESLRLSNIYNRSLIEASLDPLVTIGPDGRITDVNVATENVTGYSRVELIGSDFSDYFTEPEKAREGYQLVFKEGSVCDYSLKIQHKTGEITPVLYNASVYRDESGEVVGVFAAARDVTKLNKAKNDLKRNIEEKNVLLSEVHHRVKNNMQIISSLLNLQTLYVADDETISILKESQDRVKAMAILYEKLYLSDDLTEINFEEYICSILKGLFYTHNIKEGQVSLTIEIENIFLNIETSIPCGLIVSELVSNSFKHAFPNGEKGKIKVSLQSFGDKFELIVSDNGIGFPENLDFRNTRSLGLQLVNSLVNQIDGEISLDNSHGTRFKILFNELKYKKRI